MWEWLGETLAMDFANTLKRRGPDYEDHLTSGEAMAAWLGHQHGRVPQVEAADLAPRLDEIRALRDDVFAVLRATAAGEQLPAAPARRINDRLRRHPVVALLDTDEHVAGDPDAVDALLSRLAAATVEDVARGRGGIGFCDAPSCGQLFVPESANQRWCGAPCGNRARVARHAHANA